jgi:HEAT repeat protein
MTDKFSPESENSSVIEALILDLDNPDATVHAKASDQLRQLVRGRLGGTQVVEALIQKLSQKNSISVYFSVIYALGELGDKRAFEMLLNLLHDKNYAVVSATAEALASLGDKRALEPLLKLLDVRPMRLFWIWIWPKLSNLQAASMRYYVAMSLGRLGDTLALPQLEPTKRWDRGIWGRGHKVAAAASFAIERIKKQHT